MNIHQANALTLGLLFFLAVFPQRLLAQVDAQRFGNLENRVSNLEQHFPVNAEGGVAVFLFGAFCALWAQNTGRNPWLWFFLGLFFSVITVLVLLSRNSNDKLQRQAASS
jgi:hypothetical protein